MRNIDQMISKWTIEKKNLIKSDFWKLNNQNNNDNQQQKSYKIDKLKSRNGKVIDKPNTFDVAQRNNENSDLKVLDFNDESKIIEVSQNKEFILPEVVDQNKSVNQLKTDDVKIKSGVSRNIKYTKINSVIPNTIAKGVNKIEVTNKSIDPQEIYGISK